VYIQRNSQIAVIILNIWFQREFHPSNGNKWRWKSKSKFYNLQHSVESVWTPAPSSPLFLSDHEQPLPSQQKSVITSSLLKFESVLQRKLRVSLPTWIKHHITLKWEFLKVTDMSINWQNHLGKQLVQFCRGEHSHTLWSTPKYIHLGNLHVY
jgi:hypothetical protein